MTNELDDFLSGYNQKVRDKRTELENQQQKKQEEREKFKELFLQMKRVAIEPAIKSLTQSLTKHGHDIRPDNVRRMGTQFTEGYDIVLNNGITLVMEIKGNDYAKEVIIDFSTKSNARGGAKTGKYEFDIGDVDQNSIVESVFSELKKILVV